MDKEIAVDPVALLHAGGTKFYEIVKFFDPLSHKHVEVRRWGKVEALHSGGGQVNVIPHTSKWDLDRSVDKQVAAKEKGGYKVEKSAHAFHSNVGALVPTAFRVKLGQHYNDSALRARVIALLGLESIHTAIDEELAPKREEVPVDRGENWGSW
jgi:hypothetical protein